MKLHTKTLKSALSDLSSVIKTRTTLPALNCVRLSMTPNGRLQLQCSDCDAWVTRRIDCEGAIDPVLVNHSVLSKFVALAGTEHIELELVNGKLSMTSRGTYTIKTLPVEEFPSPPAVNGAGLSCNLSDLAEGIDSVGWAAVTDPKETGYRTTVLMDIQPKAILCAAINPHGLALFNRLAITGEERKIVIHAGQASIIAEALRHKEAIAGVTDNLFISDSPDGGAVVRLSEAPAIPYQQYMGLRGEGRGTVFNKDDLIRNCHAAIALSEADKDCRIKLLRDGGDENLSMDVVVSVFGGGDYGKETIEAPGEPLDVYLSATYMLSSLAKAPTPQVRLIGLENAVIIESGDMTYFIPKMMEPLKK